MVKKDLARIMATMELYPDTMGYGKYGVLSERTCHSDGLVTERPLQHLVQL